MIVNFVRRNWDKSGSCWTTRTDKNIGHCEGGTFARNKDNKYFHQDTQIIHKKNWATSIMSQPAIRGWCKNDSLVRVVLKLYCLFVALHFSWNWRVAKMEMKFNLSCSVLTKSSFINHLLACILIVFSLIWWLWDRVQNYIANFSFKSATLVFSFSSFSGCFVKKTL